MVALRREEATFGMVANGLGNGNLSTYRPGV
jgi:hypothetical protein